MEFGRCIFEMSNGLLVYLWFYINPMVRRAVERWTCKRFADFHSSSSLSSAHRRRMCRVPRGTGYTQPSITIQNKNNKQKTAAAHVITLFVRDPINSNNTMKYIYESFIFALSWQAIARATKAQNNQPNAKTNETNESNLINTFLFTGIICVASPFRHSNRHVQCIRMQTQTHARIAK